MLCFCFPVLPAAFACLKFSACLCFCFSAFRFSACLLPTDSGVRGTMGVTGCDLAIYEVAPVRARSPYTFPRTTHGFRTSSNDGCDLVICEVAPVRTRIPLISSHNFKQSPLTSRLASLKRANAISKESHAIQIPTQSTGSLTGQSHLVSSQGMQSDLPVPMRRREKAWSLNMLTPLHKAAVTHVNPAKGNLTSINGAAISMSKREKTKSSQLQ